MIRLRLQIGLRVSRPFFFGDALALANWTVRRASNFLFGDELALANWTARLASNFCFGDTLSEFCTCRRCSLSEFCPFVRAGNLFLDHLF